MVVLCVSIPIRDPFCSGLQNPKLFFMIQDMKVLISQNRLTIKHKGVRVATREFLVGFKKIKHFHDFVLLNLFSTGKLYVACISELYFNPTNVLSPHMIRIFYCRVSAEEIKEALDSLSPFKSLGSDVYHPFFYQIKETEIWSGSRSTI